MEETEAAEAEASGTRTETAEEAPAEEENAGAEDLDLAPMPEEIESSKGSTILTEDQDLFEDDDLPTPEEADADLDFTENK